MDIDIKNLLKYAGPSFRRKHAMVGGVVLVDYRNTEVNERNISILLSSQEIPFSIERPKLGWSGTQTRMFVTVPEELVQRTESILAAAVKASVVEVAEGTAGLSST